MIPEKLLEDFEAQSIELSENDPVFSEGNKASFFYQIKEGSIKMYNLNENGKEFVQGIFYRGESFGEPPLFGDFPYPATAIALQKTTLYKLPKQALFALLRDNFEVHLKFTSNLSHRIGYKAMIMKEMSVHSPEHRILTLVDFLKEKESPNSKYLVSLTRQQIANLTGLRVETVIRAVKQLERNGEIEIIRRKICR
ncbi:MAG: Crp/Fnr family transcriptional regulator [Bacteroidota bacterium]